MAYTYRLCVTDDPSNRIPFAAPPGYDPARFEAPARVAQALAATGVDLAKVHVHPSTDRALRETAPITSTTSTAARPSRPT